MKQRALGPTQGTTTRSAHRGPPRRRGRGPRDVLLLKKQPEVCTGADKGQPSQTHRDTVAPPRPSKDYVGRPGPCCPFLPCWVGARGGPGDTEMRGPFLSQSGEPPVGSGLVGSKYHPARRSRKTRPQGSVEASGDLDLHLAVARPHLHSPCTCVSHKHQPKQKV